MSIKSLLVPSHEGEVRDENKVYIVWSYDDVQAIYPDMSDELALEALQRVADSLKDGSIDAGWEILRTLLNEVIEEDK